MQSREIILTRETSRFWRAGLGLAFIPLGTPLFILVLQSDLTGPGKAILEVVLITAIGFLIATYLARVEPKGDGLIFTTPFKTVLISRDEIIGSHLWTLRPNHYALGIIKQCRGMPYFFHFVVLDHTNVGDFRQTVDSLRTLIASVQHDRTGSRP